MLPRAPSDSTPYVDVRSSLRTRRTTSGAREDEQEKVGRGAEGVSWSRYFREALQPETQAGALRRKYSTPWRMDRAQGSESATHGAASAGADPTFPSFFDPTAATPVHHGFAPMPLHLSPDTRLPFEPFLPEHIGSQTVKLSKPRRGYRVSSLFLGTFNEQTFDEFVIERNTKLVQGMLRISQGKTSGIALSGYGFQGHSAILLTFPAGSIAALYFGPTELVAGEDGQQRERVDLVIQTSYTPTFAAYCSGLANGEATGHIRVSAFDKEHHRLVPFLSRHFLLTLELPVSPPHAANTSSPLGSLEDLLASPSLTSNLNSLPSPVYLPELSVLRRCNYSAPALDALSIELASLSPALAFPLEWILRDGTLTPQELRDLVPEHVVPWETTASYGEDVAEDILYELRTQLVEDREARGARLRVGDALAGTRERGLDVAREAERARRKVVEERERVNLLEKEGEEEKREGGFKTQGTGRKGGLDGKVKRAHYWCRSVVVTPSGTIKFQGRLLDKVRPPQFHPPPSSRCALTLLLFANTQTNAVIRQHFDGVDHFLRVTFKDEDGLQLSSVGAGAAGEAMLHLIEGSMTKTLKKGLKLGGRTYEMLSYSQSSLRDHSVLFLAPFKSIRSVNTVRLESINTADKVRESMGDFEKVSYQPAKLGARWSQGFTATHASEILHFGSIRGLADIVETDEQGNEVTNHTDGAGIISPDLRDMIWRALLDNGFRRDQSATPPSVFQIRLGGSKGTVAVDSQLDGIVIALRPSQDKYLGKVDDEATESYVLNVADAFTRPGRLRLNPPLVSALDDLGVRTEVFLDYLQQALDELQLEEDQFVFDHARTLLVRHSFGGASRFTSLLGSLARLQTVPPTLLTDEPFLRLALNVVRTRIKRDLKCKAAIPLPDCFVLVGVPDEDRFLEENQIYAAVRDPNKPEEVRYLRGRTAMTRSPTIDPGDIRIVEGVGELPEGHALRMRNLENCVVLPTVGQRSLSSMQGGGGPSLAEAVLRPVSNSLPTVASPACLQISMELITIAALIPEETIPPRSHEAVPPVELDRPATSDDVADCFVNYLTNNTLGRIAITHLRLADFSPQHGFDPSCRQLADLHSQAVDAPKTGRVVPLADIPSIKSNKRPDFLRKVDGDFVQTNSSNAKYYESDRALGFIFRAISDDDVRTPDALRTDEPACADSSSCSFRHLRLVVERSLENLLECPPSRLAAAAATRREEVSRIRSGFCSSFKNLATVFAFPRTQGHRLSEAEVFVVANLTEADREHAARGNAVAAMGKQTSLLVEWLKHRLGSGPEGLSLLYAAWVVGTGGEKEASEDQEFGVKSFRWICLALLLEGIEDAREESKRGEELGWLAQPGRKPPGSTSNKALYYRPSPSRPVRPSAAPPPIRPTAYCTYSTSSLQHSSSYSPSQPSSSRPGRFRSFSPTRTIAPAPAALSVNGAPDPWEAGLELGHPYGFTAARDVPAGVDAEPDSGNSSDSGVGGVLPAFLPLPPSDYQPASLASRYAGTEQDTSSPNYTESTTSAERMGSAPRSQPVSYAAYRSVRREKERAKGETEARQTLRGASCRAAESYPEHRT
ncbi:SPOSA6832_01769, partial [Sporobolomyces salmonicolor]